MGNNKKHIYKWAHAGVYALCLFLVLAVFLGVTTGCALKDKDADSTVVSDEKGFYSLNGYVIKEEATLNLDSLERAGKRFKFLYDTYLADTQSKIYFSIVPDKHFFLGEEAGKESMDYDRLIKIMRDEMNFASYIDVADLLDFTDYYKTDGHFRQERIQDVAGCIAEAMGNELQAEYETVTLTEDFTGAYGNQTKLSMEAEPLRYLTNESLEACRVYDYETDSYIQVYDFDKAKKNGYDLFLSGSKALITVENPQSATGDELIVFRDSFGSSIIPLLAEAYSKITLIDTRYIAGDFVGQFVDFKNQDVLFLYGTSILNHSITLK